MTTIDNGESLLTISALATDSCGHDGPECSCGFHDVESTLDFARDVVATATRHWNLVLIEYAGGNAELSVSPDLDELLGMLHRGRGFDCFRVDIAANGAMTLSCGIDACLDEMVVYPLVDVLDDAHFLVDAFYLDDELTAPLLCELVRLPRVEQEMFTALFNPAGNIEPRELVESARAALI